MYIVNAFYCLSGYIFGMPKIHPAHRARTALASVLPFAPWHHNWHFQQHLNEREHARKIQDLAEVPEHWLTHPLVGRNQFRHLLTVSREICNCSRNDEVHLATWPTHVHRIPPPFAQRGKTCILICSRACQFPVEISRIRLVLSVHEQVSGLWYLLLVLHGIAISMICFDAKSPGVP